MKPLVFLLLTIASAWAATHPAKKHSPKKSSPPVSPAVRLAAKEEIERKIAAIQTGIENPQALSAWFAALDRAESGAPVHVLQFGDSHTASDDWVNAMRVAAQQRYGNGGPGFVQAGHPYLGYRRFDASGGNSAGWKTDGNTSHPADQNQGLSHVSISTESAGATVHLRAEGESIHIFYLQQPEGGQIEVTADGQGRGILSTAGELGPGDYTLTLPPGPHDFTLRTLDAAPVRLFGWTLDNSHGITFETLGINGAQASVLLNANETIWAAEVARRAPALVILAYGTNEANSRVWTPEQYRADLTEVVARVRRAAPASSILLVGPPDCGKLHPLLHLSEVIDIQREVSAQLSVAFWDWRLHMGGAGINRQWVLAGLQQQDHIHLTAEGYRLLGNMLFDQLEKAHTQANE